MKLTTLLLLHAGSMDNGKFTYLKMWSLVICYFFLLCPCNNSDKKICTCDCPSLPLCCSSPCSHIADRCCCSSSPPTYAAILNWRQLSYIYLFWKLKITTFWELIIKFEKNSIIIFIYKEWAGTFQSLFKYSGPFKMN